MIHVPPRPSWRRLAFAALLAPLLAVSVGCETIGAIAYYGSPRRIQKPEFEFPDGARVALVLDAAQPRLENPVLAKALYDRSRQYFRDKKQDIELKPPQQAMRLRGENPDYASWSIQKIGRELGADYVIYCRVDALQIREYPTAPIISPQIELRMKVIAVDNPEGDARVWPAGELEDEGRTVTCSRLTVHATQPDAVDREARKLGLDTAYFLTMPFIEVDLEDPRPVER